MFFSSLGGAKFLSSFKVGTGGSKISPLGIPCLRILHPQKYFILHMMDERSFGNSTGNSNNSVKSQFTNPSDIRIPLDKVEFSYARSSGPGGQNVNKLNTKAEIRFHVMSADWIPYDVRQRLVQYQSNKISNDGDLIVTSQEHRTQAKNKEDCINKLRLMLAEVRVEYFL